MSRIGTPDTLEQFIDHYHQRCKESPELDDKYQKYCKSSLAEGKKPLSLREYVHRYSREDKESIQFSDVPKFVLNPISVHLLYYIQFYMALRAYKTASKLHSHDLQGKLLEAFWSLFGNISLTCFDGCSLPSEVSFLLCLSQDLIALSESL